MRYVSFPRINPLHQFFILGFDRSLRRQFQPFLVVRSQLGFVMRPGSILAVKLRQRTLSFYCEGNRCVGGKLAARLFNPRLQLGNGGGVGASCWM